jgi:hypothetical protein
MTRGDRVARWGRGPGLCRATAYGASGHCGLGFFDA